MPSRNCKRRAFGIVFAIFVSLVTFSSAAQIRVTTWNLDWFPNGTPKEASAAEQEKRVHAAADVLRVLNPDIILLQEVRDYDTAARLASAIKPVTYQIAICSAFKEPFQSGPGRQQVVILAKEPAQAAWAEPWKSMQGIDPPRGFAFAWFKIQGADVAVYCVHLKSNLIMHGDKAATAVKNIKKREIAAGQILDHIRNVVARAMPAVNKFIVGGDFNTNTDEFASETTLTKLEQDGFQNCMEGLPSTLRVTHPGGHGYPDTTFDYLLAKGAAVGKPLITRSQASDHLPVSCDVTLATTAPNANHAASRAPSDVVKTGADEVVAASPAAPAEQNVTITHSVSMKIPYGETVLPAGTKLPIVSRDPQTVHVRYMGTVYELPISATDLR